MFNRLKRFGRAIRSFFDNPANWNYLATSARPPALAGVPMDESTCLAHLPIFAAVNKIATDMSILDMYLEQHLTSGGTRRAIQNRLHRLMSFSPCPLGTIHARTWRKSTLGHLLTWGNSYSEIEFSYGGDVLGWHLLHPDRVEPKFVDGELVYQYTYPTERGGGTDDIPAWKILHFAGLSYEGIKGYSPIALARENLALGRAADLFGAAFFGNAARPSGILKITKPLSPQGKAQLREDFTNMHGGPFATGRIVIGEDGMEFQSITIPPDDAQFLGTKEAAKLDVNLLYGIPNVESGSLEEQNAKYLQSVLLGWCSVLESEIELKCLRPEEQGASHVRHDFKPLLRPSAATRASVNAIEMQWGKKTVNEWRAEDGEGPVKGGDNRIYPLNFAMIDPEGNIIPPPQQPAPNGQQPAAPPGPGSTASEDQSQQANQDQTQSVPAVQRVVRSELQRALRRESAALRRAATKPGFREAIEKIYAEHEPYMVEALEPSTSALAAVSGLQVECRGLVSDWVEESKRQLLELESVTTADQRAEAVGQLLETWEERRTSGFFS